jgi:hypothetical protein
VENVIVLQTSAHRQSMVNRASAYVGTSRTRRELFLVVDDFERALAAMERAHQKSAALDLATGRAAKPQSAFFLDVPYSRSPVRRLELGLRPDE